MVTGRIYRHGLLQNLLGVSVRAFGSEATILYLVFFYVPSSYLRRQILKSLASSNLNLFLLTFATPPPSTPAFPE